ncbi:putative disease resistance RPP13-like protein 1 [Humulus lupulus]|uniref:putative disease resistance RPP13-like protein 1 n=1 Tax=Humulus lupulus TaxID=3486 RepID=UPI002B414BF2|nr:putative disease resistance RPP13-like protein 1 [Humulus lupulus]
MPSQINKLMNLQTLTTFVVGKDSGAKLEELAELSSLRGKLSIKKLENVINITKASNKVNILDKKPLDKLSLKWSNGVGDLKHGEAVLDMLSPNTVLKQLKIDYYPGTKFSNWVGDDSFCNVVHVGLWNCQRCSNLPPLGQLPWLKSLYISGFDSVVTVGSEFYGNSYVRKPFSSLETLSFKNMSSWEQWQSMQTEDATTYGKLKTLEIFYCPELIGDLPRFFPCLTKLNIHVDKKFALTTLSFPCVKEITIGGVESTESLWEALKLQQNMSHFESSSSLMSTSTPFYHPLESLHLTRCGESFRSLHMDLFPNLKSLAISYCNYFEALSMSDGQCQELTSLSSLSIWCCPSFVSFPKDGLIAPKLTFINISECPKLKWLPEKMTFISLHVLCISYKPLVSVMNWDLQTLSNLKHVRIVGTGEDKESFPEEGLLPATITSLGISTFSKLRALDKNGLKQLTSLQTLEIFSCPELQTLSEEGFSTSLRYLNIHGCPLLKKIYNPESENKECWSKISHIPHIQFY